MDGDKISLLEGNLQFIVRVANEIDMHDASEATDDCDATLLEASLPQNARTPQPPVRQQQPQQQQQHYQYKLLAAGATRPHLRPPVRQATPAAVTTTTTPTTTARTNGVAAYVVDEYANDETIDPTQIETIRVIGRGSCGEVSLARWRGGLVACKKIFRTLTKGDAMQEFLSEARILRRVRHPNIVLFMGMYNVDGETGILTESVYLKKLCFFFYKHFDICIDLCFLSYFKKRYVRRGSLADVLVAGF